LAIVLKSAGAGVAAGLVNGVIGGLILLIVFGAIGELRRGR
jgi:hypothetical protein